MKFCLLILFVFIVTSVSGQKFSAGVGTGGSYWTSFGSGSTASWDNGVFARYEAKRRVALELSYVQFSLGGLTMPSFDPNGPTITGQKDKFRELAVTMQLRCSAKDRKFRQYIGAVLTYGFHRSERIYLIDTVISTTTSRFASIGLSHSIIYPLFRHCNLSLKSSLQFPAGDSPLYYFADFGLRLQSLLGVAYRI